MKDPSNIISCLIVNYHLLSVGGVGSNPTLQVAIQRMNTDQMARDARRHIRDSGVIQQKVGGGVTLIFENV